MLSGWQWVGQVYWLGPMGLCSEFVLSVGRSWKVSSSPPQGQMSFSVLEEEKRANLHGVQLLSKRRHSVLQLRCLLLLSLPG